MLSKITRAEAKTLGLKRFYVGPCKQGHDSERLVSSRLCLICARIMRDQWAAQNKEHLKSYFAAYDARRAADEKRIQPRRESEKENRVHNNAMRRARYAKNPQRILEANKQSQQRHIEKHRLRVNAKKRNRNARKKAVGGTHSPADIRAILKMQSGKCGYCRIALRRKYHMDHIVPLSRGGHNGRSNLQVLCPTCNLTKADRDPLDFARMLGRLL